MKESYVYFSLFESKQGTHIDIDLISKKLNIQNSNIDIKSNYSRTLKTIQKEYLDMNKLVKEIIDQLYDKIKVINEIKKELQLESLLRIVLCINTNELISTPYIGHDHKTIDFLYKTGTTTDIDIYNFLEQ